MRSRIVYQPRLQKFDLDLGGVCGYGLCQLWWRSGWNSRTYPLRGYAQQQSGRNFTFLGYEGSLHFAETQLYIINLWHKKLLQMLQHWLKLHENESNRSFQIRQSLFHSSCLGNSSETCICSRESFHRFISLLLGLAQKPFGDKSLRSSVTAFASAVSLPVSLGRVVWAFEVIWRCQIKRIINNIWR